MTAGFYFRKNSPLRWNKTLEGPGSLGGMLRPKPIWIRVRRLFRLSISFTKQQGFKFVIQKVEMVSASLSLTVLRQHQNATPVCLFKNEHLVVHCCF